MPNDLDDLEFEYQFRFQKPDNEGRFRPETARAGRIVPVQALLNKLFPVQHKKLDLLTDVVHSWASVVGPVCADKSAPYDLIGTKLYIASNSSLVRAQIIKMRGTIYGKLKTRWNIDCNEIFVSAGPAPVKPTIAHQHPQRQHAKVTITDQEVEKKLELFAKDAGDENQGLVERNSEVARALAHLQVFFEKRFQNNNA